MRPEHRWIILAIVSSALLLIVIDMTVLYTALPRLTVDLGATPSEKLWIVNAYALTVAGLLPGAGALGDRFGPKPMFLGGLVIFGIGSLLAAFAPTPEMLIAGRVVLAVGAAMAMPSTLSIIRHTFEDERERTLAIGIWAAIASGGAAFGPVLGGLLLEFFWWGSVFLINVPVVLVALLAGIAMIPRLHGGGHNPFSLGASVQIMIGLVATTLAIKELGKPAPSLPLLLVAGLVGIAFIVLFIRGQMRAAQPMLDLRLFADPGFSGGVLMAVMASGILIGIQLAMTQWFQLVLNLSPLEAGIRLLPLPLAAFVAGPVAGRILPTYGARRLLPQAMICIGAGVLLYLLALSSPALQAVAMVLIGLGVGAGMTTASASILHSAPAESAGTAASVEEVSYELGGAVGVTIFGSILAAIYMRAFVPPSGIAEIGNAGEGIDQARAQMAALPADQATALGTAAQAAFETAFIWVLITAVGVSLLGAALVARRMAGRP